MDKSSSCRISDYLRKYWDESPLVDQALRMLVSSQMYSRNGYMSKNNYVNIHHVWWPLVSDLKARKFDHDSVDRTWVYIEGIIDPLDFGEFINGAIDRLLSASTLVNPENALDKEEIKMLPDHLEKSDVPLTPERQIYKITAQGMLKVFSELVNPMCYCKLIDKINTLVNIHSFNQISDCRDLALTKYRNNRFIDFRIILRNIFRRFYTDNSAFDYLTQNPALTSPYDDRDSYSDVSEDYYREPCIYGE